MSAPSSWNAAVNVLGDVVFLDIRNVVSLDSTYCFNLNIDTPGIKKIVFRIREWVEEAVEPAESATNQTSSQPVVASPCNLLTRRMGNPNPDPANPTVPWKSNNDGTSSSEESSASSVDELSSLGSQKGSAKPKKLRKSTSKVTNDKKGSGPTRSGREECMHVARWIPRGIDMFVILKDTFHIARYMEAEEAAKTSTKSEDEDLKREQKDALSIVTKDAQERHLKTYQRILFSAPHLQTLIRGRHNRTKLETELNSILSEMQEIIGQIRSEDASHLKPFIGNYAVAQPEVKGLEPLIFSENKKFRARMGVNHPQLAGMSCLVKHVNAYHADPKKVQEQLQNGEIRMNAGAWPALAYPGDPPGVDFDVEDIQEGLLRGHLLKRVLRHIYTSPSSALIDNGELSVTCSGNAELHGMYKVEAKHIAYALVQSRFGISSRDKWQETDGNYSYRDAYYRTIKAIREPFDEAWAEELLEWWNKTVFGNKRDDEDLILMRKQSAKRAAAQVQSATSVIPPVEAKPTGDPDISTVHPSMPTTSMPATSVKPRVYFR
ncbi:hypothetical protein EV424DRAFT_1649225 [Suillus variegatus]|nr:hypothetical protein EV424DRAFT_1649225 [Suillus variegatus]